MGEGIDIKQLIVEAKKHLKLEVNYGKLTAVEKSSIILSRITLICVLAIIGCFAMFYITSLIMMLLVKTTGIVWLSNLIMIEDVSSFTQQLLILMSLVFAFRKQLIIDPITRFLSKLFLKPDEDE